MFGKLNSINVIGVPGCAKSLTRNGFDMILEKACFGITLNKMTISEMSDGGLFKSVIRKHSIES